MKRLFPLYSGILVLALLVISASADESILGRDKNELLSVIQSSLPVEGMVIYTQDNEIYVDLTREKGAAIGKKYVIERPGAEIRHPVTNEVMGNARNKVCDIEITWMLDGFCKAKVVGTTAAVEVRNKDLVRPAAPAVVRFPLRHDDGTLSKLTAAADGEIAALLSGLTNVAVSQGPAIALKADAASTLVSMASEADLAVAGNISGKNLEVSIVKVASGSLVKTFTIPISDALIGLGDEKVRAVPTYSATGSLSAIGYKEGGEIAIALAFIPVDMAVADINGDGMDEIVFAEDRHLRVCKLKLDGTLEELSRQSLGFTAKLMKVFAGDIDRDGKAEVYVTEKPANYIRSSAWRYENGKFTRFWKESDVFLRVVRTTDGDHLYGQKYGSANPFERGVMKYTLAGNSLRSAAAGLPNKLTVFDFTIMKPSGIIASLDYENKIKLYLANGTSSWRSSDCYGGSDIKIESGDKRNSQEERIGLSSIDLDGDGVDELLAAQNLMEGGLVGSNIRLGNIQQYKAGRVVALAYEEGALVERWKSKNYNGIMKGFTLSKPLARGWEAVFFSVESLSMFQKKATLRALPLN